MGASENLSEFEDESIREFREAVAKSAPKELEVEPLEGGFKIFYRETIPDYGDYRRFSSSYLAVVLCDPLTRVFTMEDQGMLEYGSLRSLTLGKETFRGRSLESRFSTVMERQADGSFTAVESVRQSTRELHAAVRKPAAALGWKEKQPLSAKIGMIVAITTGGGLVLSGIVLAVLALTGNFP